MTPSSFLPAVRPSAFLETTTKGGTILRNSSTNSERLIHKYRRALVILLGVTAALGLVMVLSSSYQYSQTGLGNPFYYFSKQALFLLLGLVLAVACSQVRASFWARGPFFLYYLIGIFLALTLVPGIGIEKNGASRWVSLGGASFQPAEFIKYAMIPFALKFFEGFSKRHPYHNGIFALLLIAPLAPLVFQPDFGSLFIILALLGLICLVSSFPRKYFYSAALAAVIFLGLLVVSRPYRIKRFMAFWDPWKDPTNSGFQITQSLMSIAHGGMTGQGLGNSLGKLHYLPEAHNDFIFSIIGEETGFMGILIVVGLFMAIVTVGLKLAQQVPSPTSSKIVATIFFGLGIQALLNMGVVLSLLPTKGLNLPLISYGGSSLLATSVGIGMVFSLTKKSSLSEHCGL